MKLELYFMLGSKAKSNIQQTDHFHTSQRTNLVSLMYTSLKDLKGMEWNCKQIFNNLIRYLDLTGKHFFIGLNRFY